MEYMNGHPVKVTRIEAENEVESESESDYEPELEVVNVREKVNEYINGHPVVITRVEDEAEEADVEEKRARSEGDDGGRQKKIAVEIHSPRRILNRREPMDTDKDASKDSDNVGKHKPNLAAKQQVDNHSGKTPTKSQKRDIAKVSKILDGTVPTQWLRVKGVSPSKQRGASKRREDVGALLGVSFR